MDRHALSGQSAEWISSLGCCCPNDPPPSRHCASLFGRQTESKVNSIMKFNSSVFATPAPGKGGIISVSYVLCARKAITIGRRRVAPRPAQAAQRSGIAPRRFRYRRGPMRCHGQGRKHSSLTSYCTQNHCFARRKSTTRTCTHECEAVT